MHWETCGEPRKVVQAKGTINFGIEGLISTQLSRILYSGAIRMMGLLLGDGWHNGIFRKNEKIIFEHFW
jgi:hypothetical protein